MDAQKVYDLAINYNVSMQELAKRFYRETRDQAIESASAAFQNTSVHGQDDNMSRAVHLLRATEALAYSYYVCHGKFIDEDEDEDHLNSPKQVLDPDWAIPQSLHFSMQTASSEDRPSELHLSREDFLRIHASLRRKFPKWVPWMREDDSI